MVAIEHDSPQKKKKSKEGKKYHHLLHTHRNHVYYFGNVEIAVDNKLYATIDSQMKHSVKSTET